MSQREKMAAVVEGLPTKSAKIRALDAAGYARADIARFLDIRYQHVRTVLIQGPPKRERPAVPPAAPPAVPPSQPPGASGDDRPAARLALNDSAGAVYGIGDRVEVKIGPGGRIVIPAAFRAAMEAAEGDTLVATVDGDGIVQLASAPAALRMAQRIVCATVPADVSLSDSLIEDRRREAAREALAGSGLHSGLGSGRDRA